MSPSSRANRPALGCALLAFVLIAPPIDAAPTPTPPQLQPPASPDDTARYRHCLDAARSTPQQGLADAEAWRDAGGGFAADHCAAVALFGLQRYAEAAARFEALAGAMMQRGPDLRAGALEQAGQAWLLAGKPEAAKTAFDGALRFTPDDPELLVDRARAFAAEQRFHDAIADLDTVLGQVPDRADALVYRASAYRQLGELARARADIDAALERVPSDAAGHLERGNIRRLAGDEAGAREDWAEVARLAPGTPAAQAAGANLAALPPQPKPTE